MGTVCPSTALAYFFHNSSASRGLLPLEAVDAGLFEGAERDEVVAFAERVLTRLGLEGRWMANFASESAKSSTASISISTAAEPATVDGRDGWVLNGVKSFGCATGVADDYLVTATFPGGSTADHLGVFLVDRRSAGVGERSRWDAIGMRATATHGITLTDVFVSAEDALAVPGAFPKMMQVSRGSFVGSQVAGTAVYLGAATAAYRFALAHLRDSTFADTGEPIGTAPFQQELLGRMTADLTTATLWLTRQLELETSDPPLLGQGRRRSAVATGQGVGRPARLRRRDHGVHGLRHLQHDQQRRDRPDAARPVDGAGPGVPGREGPHGGRHDAGARDGIDPVRPGGREHEVSVGPPTVPQLEVDLAAMRGVWRDRLHATGPDGVELRQDDAGGVPGAFPYENLVYVDLDDGAYTQTNVVLSGRELHERTFTATVTDGVLRFDHLGPEAPAHLGVSAGAGLIWFVAESITHEGVGRYAEPDLIRIEGDRRWRDTVLWRHGALARLLH